MCGWVGGAQVHRRMPHQHGRGALSLADHTLPSLPSASHSLIEIFLSSPSSPCSLFPYPDRYDVPLVADIHFLPQAAMEAAKAGEASLPEKEEGKMKARRNHVRGLDQMTTTQMGTAEAMMETTTRDERGGGPQRPDEARKATRQY